MRISDWSSDVCSSDLGLPLLQRLSKLTPPNGARKPRALVLVPTRELAVQVADSITTYGRHLRLNVTTIFGGAGMGPHVDNPRRGVDIPVATPGRLLAHPERGSAKLAAIEVLVLDGAHRLPDMCFCSGTNHPANTRTEERRAVKQKVRT